ncbi:unnamed protein product [Rhizoctonia solani]|nr:unnamed protein product [Rhizoctonia solani]
MVSGSPTPGLLSFIAILLITPASRALLENKTVDDAYIYSSDRPDGIQYHPAWGPDNGDPNRWDSTYTYSKKPTSNLVYFFRGDAIYYYGEIGGSDHAPFKVNLDGDQKGEIIATNTSASSIQYQQLLWNKTGLGPGDHQIVISNAGQDNQIVGLDYFIIESDHGFRPTHSGPYASSIPPGAIIVDDTDYGHITYNDWQTTVYESSDHGFYYNNSLHRTAKRGSYATFKFNGTAVWYITDCNRNHGVVNITLDGNIDITSTYSPTQLSQQNAWNATDLAYGEHTVIVTHEDRGDLYTTLDYFMYLPGEPPQKSNSSTGAIAGGVIGGIALIALGVAGWMLVKRRRAAKARSEIDLGGIDEPPLLSHGVESFQPGTLLPSWGYVTSPYVPELNGNPGALPNHDREHRPRKGQPIEPPVVNAAASSATPTFYSEESATRESYRDEPDVQDRDANLSPPPYVRV